MLATQGRRTALLVRRLPAGLRRAGRLGARSAGTAGSAAADSRPLLRDTGGVSPSVSPNADHSPSPESRRTTSEARIRNGEWYRVVL